MSDGQSIAIALISAGVSAIAVPFILSKLSGAGNSADSDGEFNLLCYSEGMRISMYVCTAFFLGLAMLAWRFPGKTDPASMPWIIALFASAALLSALTAVLMSYSKVFWNDSQVSGTDSFGRRRTFAWADLSGLEYVSWAQSLKIMAANGSYIWVSPVMRGFTTFEKKLDAEAGRLQIIGLESEWKRQMESAKEAFLAGNLPETEKCLLLAVSEGENYHSLDPRLSFSLSALGDLKTKLKSFEEAEDLYRRALDLAETIYGSASEDLSSHLFALARCLKNQSRIAEAESLARRALAIDESKLGSEHPNLAGDLDNLADLLVLQGKFSDAESLCMRARVIAEKAFGQNRREGTAVLAISLNALAELYLRQGKFSEAESFCKEAIAFIEREQGKTCPYLVVLLGNYVEVLRQTGRVEEAKEFESRKVALESL
jgi:tetratricopeptide (TPR) repeat protein